MQRTLTVAVCLLVAGSVSGADDMASAPVYYIQPLGDVAPEHSRYACRTITRRFEIRCKVLRARPLPRRAYNARRNQYDSDRVVQKLFNQLPRDGLGLMALTNGDLYDAGRSRFVFGLASLVDHVGVLSLARYRGPWWGQADKRSRFYERFMKVLVHEVGHTLGVRHCPNRRCAMRNDSTLADLDSSPRTFCERCQGLVERGRSQGPGTLVWHYTRGHAHLQRGQFARAVYHLERAAELGSLDARVNNDLGVAYLRRGDRARALWQFRLAQQLDPDFAYARYNEGLVFVAAADPMRARASFEAAISIDPGWAPAHRQLGYLCSEVLDDPEAALLHFEAYLAAHGDDSQVEERVRLIKGGGGP